MKTKHIVILVLIFLLVAVLSSVLVYAALKYRKMGLAELPAPEGSFTFNGKVFLPENGEGAAYWYEPMGNTPYREARKHTLDLAPFGFEGEVFTFYTTVTEDGTAYPVSDGYEPLWPAMVRDRLLFQDDSGIYQIYPREGKCFPVFSDSIEGVDVYGKDVLAFSENAFYAVGLKEGVVTVYHTDPMDYSLRVVEVDTVDLTPFGDEITFCAFVGEKTAYFRVLSEGKVRFVALECEKKEAVLTHLAIEEDTPVFSRVWAALPVQEADQKDGVFAVWSNLLLDLTVKARGELSAETALLAISPKGTYGVGEDKGELFVFSQNRTVSLTEKLNGETVDAISFPEDNVLFLHLTDRDGNKTSRSFKICF